MKAFGFRIDCSMKGLTGIPAFLALGTIEVPRFGPTVPVVPAAASVWQLPQPAEPVNTALPAAALVLEDELEDDEPDEDEPDELEDDEEPPPLVP